MTKHISSAPSKVGLNQKYVSLAVNVHRKLNVSHFQQVQVIRKCVLLLVAVEDTVLKTLCTVFKHKHILQKLLQSTT